LLLMVAGIFGMTACSPSFSSAIQTANVKETQISAAPTPALESAENYPTGISQIPMGKYLFVELSIYDDCSEECDCPVVEPPRSVYEWSSSGELCMDEYFYQHYFTDSTEAVPPPSILGFFGYGRWREEFSAINTLPYNEYYIPVYSIDSNGVIVIGIKGKKYFLEPGQTWVDSGQYESEPPVGCIIYYTNTMRNYGLLMEDQIHPCE